MKRFFFLFISLIIVISSSAQTLTGTIKDSETSEPLIGASVVVKGTANGTVTDMDGNFSFVVTEQLPIVVIVSYIGYVPQEISVKNLSAKLMVKLVPDKVILKEVEITGNRLSEKQKESPLTVESMDQLAIKQTPAFNFYEGLGQLKGVDVTSASLSFKIINTRGFNSTSPVRSLQIIDGVDNQAPGLNFSLGNFLGAPDLDVLKVDLIVGASSAYYGPNAFNGVISMTTKDPFETPGFTISLKGGERDLFEGAFRWCDVLKNKEGKEKFAYKINGYLLRAYDWEATNLNPIDGALDGKDNPGGYDAVNRYGDEFTLGNDFTQSTRLFPGLDRFYRNGYEEKDLVDYNTRNYKITTAFHYKFNDDLRLIYSFNFGSGTTVYQGDNRYSLKGILFLQNRIELQKANKFFVRAYASNENSGQSYDAYFTALLLQQYAKPDNEWSTDYSNFWGTVAVPVIKELPGYPAFQFPVPDWYDDSIKSVLASNPDLIAYYHELAHQYANDSSLYPNQHGYYVPGTAAFDSAFNSITSRESYSQGGTMFYDRSALYHVQGEYKFTPHFMDIVLGGNVRQYRPNSHGTIFSDTAGRIITNTEFGIYAGAEKRMMQDHLKLNLTARLDKNENFPYLVSPAASAVYTLNKHVFRASFSSAIRNPTLADQYLYYNVGRAILLGNIYGFDSLVTVPSLFNFFDTQNKDTLEYFNVKPLRPEQVKTIEGGYRASLFSHLFLDAEAYYSWYRYFIGYKLGASIDYNEQINKVAVHEIYRIAANTNDMVTTAGFSVGLNYYFEEFYTITGNYSFNRLDRRGSTDPIIPAFNTPENKFNIGISGRDIKTKAGFLNQVWSKLPVIPINNYGFAVNYKWVEGFLYEGSPQFTGFVPSYGLLDAQVNKSFPKIHLNVKVGASNLLNNKVYQVYGGPYIGRLAFVQAVFDFPKGT